MYWNRNNRKTMNKGNRIIWLFAMVFMTSNVAMGQEAEAFFNKAANEYIYTKEKLALTTIDQGLSMYPDDKPLEQLKEKILKEKEKKKKEKNKDQQQKQDKQKKNKDKQNNKDQQKKEQQKKDKQEKQEKGDEQKDKKNQKENQQPAEDQEKKDQQDKKNQMPPKSRQEKLKDLNMSEEKAKMILEAMRTNEIQYLQQMRRKATKKPDSGKPDW